MVDEGRVARLLRGVAERTGRLRDIADRREQAGDVWLDAVKYLFVTTIEACVDVAQHIVAAEGWGTPDSNADAIRTLASHDVIHADLADSVARAVGFRNVLVHQYTAVDDDIVRAMLDRLHEFDEFVAGVSAWLLGPDATST